MTAAMAIRVTALSYSHQPESVNVRSTTCAFSVLPSISMGRVNFAPILGSTPSRESTRVSVAASSVPSAGRRPSAGSMKECLASVGSM